MGAGDGAIGARAARGRLVGSTTPPPVAAPFDQIPAGYTTHLPVGMALELEGETPPSTRGDMVLNGCEQPALASPAEGLVADLVVEVAVFLPAVGA